MTTWGDEWPSQSNHTVLKKTQENLLRLTGKNHGRKKSKTISLIGGGGKKGKVPNSELQLDSTPLPHEDVTGAGCTADLGCSEATNAMRRVHGGK